jgi:N-acetylmuramoyl-L-alanine amidase
LVRASLLLFATAFSLQAWPALAATCSVKAAGDTVIVLDVGHIARQPGQQCYRGSHCSWGETSARGTPEYDFNLKLAQRIRQELMLAGFSSAYVFVTHEDAPAGLDERANRANGMNADIFLSIHHDGVDDHYLTPWLYQGKRNFYFDDAKGFSLHVSPRNIRYDESLDLAQILADRLMEKGLSFTTVHETRNPAGARVPFADPARGIYLRDGNKGLVVLRKARMPAVLLEAGMIVNRDEELIVLTSSYQRTVAEAVTQAVRTFCTAHDVLSYRVVGVRSDDVLNIRSGPNANLSIVGAIPPNGRGIQIAGTCTGQWCPIKYQNLSGWVNRTFLARE